MLLKAPPLGHSHRLILRKSSPAETSLQPNAERLRLLVVLLVLGAGLRVLVLLVVLLLIRGGRVGVLFCLLITNHLFFEVFDHSLHEAAKNIRTGLAEMQKI